MTRADRTSYFDIYRSISVVSASIVHMPVRTKSGLVKSGAVSTISPPYSMIHPPLPR